MFFAYCLERSQWSKPVDHPTKLKARFPDDFSSNSEDDLYWGLTLLADFTINKALYNNNAMLLTALA